MTLTHAQWLRHDLEIIEAHYGMPLDRGVGKSLMALADRLDGAERTATVGTSRQTREPLHRRGARRVSGCFVGLFSVAMWGLILLAAITR